MAGIIVHEWLAQFGGSENVVQEISEEFPDAKIKCLWNQSEGRFAGPRVSESWIGSTALRNHKVLAMPFMPATWRFLGHEEADWILCSSHLFSHHARFSGPAINAPKYVYAHTPARYIWNPELDIRGKGIFPRLVSQPLKVLDRHRAREPKSIASNSRFVQKRIENAWRRDSQVIYPPVSVATFANETSDLTEKDLQILTTLPTEFILGASRFIEYKRLDLVIDLGRINKVPVVLAGEGPAYIELKAKSDESPGSVTFIIRPSQRLLQEIYKRAIAYVFPAEEDFGIMPVEAMATGTPVIGLSTGGVSESIIEGITGLLINENDFKKHSTIVSEIEKFDASACVNRAWEFDAQVFRSKIREWVSE